MWRPPKKVSGNLIGSIIPYLLILMCMTGAIYPSVDLTAGEKERGTMETLLCSPVARTHLVIWQVLDGADRRAGDDLAVALQHGRVLCAG